LGFAEEGRFVLEDSVRKEKGADLDWCLEGLTQNWHFLTFLKRFLAARGHSLRNPDGFRSSLPSSYPMGAIEYDPPKNTPGR